MDNYLCIKKVLPVSRDYLRGEIKSEIEKLLQYSVVLQFDSVREINKYRILPFEFMLQLDSS